MVVEGLNVDLETRHDGQSNWQGAVAGGEDDNPTAPADLFLPLFEFVSLKNITITHRNRQSEKDTWLAPADVYFGRGHAILKQREGIKRKTMENRRLQYRKYAA